MAFPLHLLGEPRAEPANAKQYNARAARKPLFRKSSRTKQEARDLQILL